MALLQIMGVLQLEDSNGLPRSGAKAYTYQTGTTTPLTTYSDSGLTTPHANPIVADSEGRFAPVYVPATTDVKVTFKTSADATLFTVDPVPVTATVGALSVDTAQLVSNSVTNAKAADMATNTVKMRKTAGTGDPEDATAAEFAQAFSTWYTLESAASSGASYIKDSIPSWVNWLRITFDLFPASDGIALNMLARKASGTDITAYDYEIDYGSGATPASETNTAQTVMKIFGAVQNDANVGGVAGTVEIFNIQSSRYKRAIVTWHSRDSNQIIGKTGFMISDTAALTGIKVVIASGNISNGRMLVEGHA